MFPVRGMGNVCHNHLCKLHAVSVLDCRNSTDTSLLSESNSMSAIPKFASSIPLIIQVAPHAKKVTCLAKLRACVDDILKDGMICPDVLVDLWCFRLSPMSRYEAVMQSLKCLSSCGGQLCPRSTCSISASMR